MFLGSTLAATRQEHLLRPDLGRQLSPQIANQIIEQVEPNRDLQVVIGDGLSAAAVHAQVPVVLPALNAQATLRGWSIGRPFAIRHCRVGVMNDIGAALSPRVLVLLVGERPGLSTAESLSAYVAFRPTHGQNDSDRNLVSNIHARGTRPAEAAERIAQLIDAILAAGYGGHRLKQPDREPQDVVPGTPRLHLRETPGRAAASSGARYAGGRERALRR
jgi:ethanolamine ammonia-lyase small subunit